MRMVTRWRLQPLAKVPAAFERCNAGFHHGLLGVVLVCLLLAGAPAPAQSVTDGYTPLQSNLGEAPKRR